MSEDPHFNQCVLPTMTYGAEKCRDAYAGCVYDAGYTESHGACYARHQAYRPNVVIRNRINELKWS